MRAFVNVATNKYEGIKDTWILMDNQSTINIFLNLNLLTNIQKGNVKMKVRSTGGGSTTRLHGDFSNYGKVWFSKKGMANILSFNNIVRKFRVLYDSTKEDAFVVHTDNRKIRSLYHYQGACTI